MGVVRSDWDDLELTWMFSHLRSERVSGRGILGVSGGVAGAVIWV